MTAVNPLPGIPGKRTIMNSYKVIVQCKLRATGAEWEEFQISVFKYALRCSCSRIEVQEIRRLRRSAGDCRSRRFPCMIGHPRRGMGLFSTHARLGVLMFPIPMGYLPQLDRSGTVFIECGGTTPLSILDCGLRIGSWDKYRFALYRESYSKLHPMALRNFIPHSAITKRRHDLNLIRISED